ncbi:MAG: hypothetical protein HYX65_12925 [Gemmatimonadetes bacterium]|nr:hypothetical protein [Gemmatimonadota bacterium]
MNAALRRPRRLALLGAAGAAVLAVAAACDPTLPLQALSEDQKLASIDATPDSTNLRVGDSVRVLVRYIGKGGGSISPTGTPVFTVGNPLVVSVAAGGWVKAIRLGRSEVLATVSGKRDGIVVQVVP